MRSAPLLDKWTLIYRRVVILLVTMLSLNAALAYENSVDDPVVHPAIPLLDEAGKHVLDSGNPYSSRTSCGTSGCHNYEQITHAFHFQMGRDEASDDFGEKRGLPNLVSPGYFGGYNCMGGNNPDMLAKKKNESAADFSDRGAAGFVQRCASCHMGGGWMEHDRNGNRYDETDPTTVANLDGDYFNRGTNEQNQPASEDMVTQWDWKKSGVIEADCFMCHTDYSNLIKLKESPSTSNALSEYQALRRSKLIGKGYFRYANSAMFAFMNLNATDDSTEDKTLLSFAKTEHTEHSSHGGGYDYDLSLQNELPNLTWNAAAFDSNKKVSIPMLKFPTNENCMQCHLTSNSRRGFYGFGEASKIETDTADGGTLIEDYQDDVHKGKTWTEANGETRSIENCNACHSRRYFDPSYSNVDLDANHNFLKGNSDMDLRNDLDYSPNARSCEYCHDEAPNKAIPSGHNSMLEAHREIWKANGDMTGYPKDTLTSITQTHLDVVSCQACHITDKKYGSGSSAKDIQLSYRYRQAEDGVLKIVPYNPRIRAYWKDKNSGRILTSTERNSVFEAGKDKQGNSIGLIKNPVSGAELAQVSARMSHGSLQFSDPTTVEGVKALKAAYDALLASKGVTGPDTAQVWTESNEYLISHNTRSAAASVQCDSCHNKKQDGAFSSLLKVDGLFGEQNTRVVTKLPNRSLVDDGTVLLDLDYMKIQDDGTVMENISDILYTTKVDPFMSILKASSSSSVTSRMTLMPDKNEAINSLNLSVATTDRLLSQFGSDGVLMLKNTVGDSNLRRAWLMVDGGANHFADYRIEMEIAEKTVRDSAAAAGKGSLKSAMVTLTVKDQKNRTVSQFNNDVVFVKLPYDGDQTDLANVTVLTSGDGMNWTTIAAEDLIDLQSTTPQSDGFVIFRTNHFSYFVVANSVTAVDVSTETNGSGSSSSGGGSLNPWLLMLLLPGFIGFRGKSYGGKIDEINLAAGSQG